MDFLKAPWELYNITDDFSQANDLAAKNPDKLKQLQALREQGFHVVTDKFGNFETNPQSNQRCTFFC